MADLSELDLTGTEPSREAGNFELLKSGLYPACIVDSELADTKDGTGRMLKLTLQITDGEHKGRTFFDRLNIYNKSEQAQEIARKTLRLLTDLCGVNNLGDSKELHDVPLCIRLGTTEYQGEKRNEIKGYAAADKWKGDAPAQAAPAARPAPRPAVAGSAASVPWKRQG